MAKIKPETRVEHQLDDIITALNGGGSGGASLPDVTVADNGKVLGVVEGAWDKTTVPSGVEKFIVTLTPYGATYGRTDKTIAEITEAYNAGKEIWFSGTNGVVDFTGIVSQVSHNKSSPSDYSIFSALVVNSDLLSVVEVGGGSADAPDDTSYNIVPYTLTPILP